MGSDSLNPHVVLEEDGVIWTISWRRVWAFVSPPSYDVSGASRVLRLARLEVFAFAQSLKGNKLEFKESLDWNHYEALRILYNLLKRNGLRSLRKDKWIKGRHRVSSQLATEKEFVYSFVRARVCVRSCAHLLVRSCMRAYMRVFVRSL